MGFITNESLTNKLRYQERLSRDQEAIRVMGSEWSPARKIERMQRLGYELDDILYIAFAWEKIDEMGASEFAAKYLILGEQV